MTYPGRVKAGAALICPEVQAGSRCPRHSHCPWGPSLAAVSRSLAGALSGLASPCSLPQRGTWRLEGGRAQPRLHPKPSLVLQGDAAGTDPGQPFAPQVSWRWRRRWVVAMLPHAACPKGPGCPMAPGGLEMQRGGG